MNISISTYQVKKGDTLESVSEKLGISAEALKRYHNTYCDLKNLIGQNLNGIHEILIPPSEKIAEIKDIQKEISLNQNLPSAYLTTKFYASNYEVTERFEQHDRENFEVKYSISVHLRETLDKGFVAELKNYGFRKNNQDSDDKISLLSLACMESISPISFLIPAQGKIKGFYDHKSIIKKFESKRSDLEDFFVGEVATSYFNKFHASLANEAFLLKKFSATLLYQILFPEMDWFRRKKEWEENFYFISNSFPLKCKFEIEYNHDNPDVVETTIHGNSIDDCSLQELIKGNRFEEMREEKVSGKIQIKYTTDKITKQLLGADAEVTLWYEDEIYSKHILTFVEKKKEKEFKKFSTLVEE
jgi:hypothetical protein